MPRLKGETRWGLYVELRSLSLLLSRPLIVSEQSISARLGVCDLSECQSLSVGRCVCPCELCQRATVTAVES